MKYFGFEFKKLILTKKFLITLILIVAAISILLGRNISQQDYAHKQQVDEVSSFIKFHRTKDNMYDQTLKDMEAGEDEELELVREKNEEILHSARVWHNNINRGEDWRTLVSNEIAFLNQVNELKEMDEEHPLSDDEVIYRLTLNQALLDQDVPPEYEEYSIALPNFGKQIVDLFVMYGSFFIVILLMSELLSSEFENRSISFLFTQPVRRANIVFAKFLSAVVMYIAVLFLLLVTTFVTTSIFGEQGSFDYPVIIEVNEVLQTIPISDYLANALIMNVAIILLMITLYLLVSLLTKHTLLSLFLMVGMTLLGYMLTIVINWKQFAWFNPFRYALSTDAILHQNDQVWYQALPVTIVLAIIILMVTMQKIKTSKIE